MAGAGLYATGMGFRWIGKKAGVSEPYDQWHSKFGGFLKIIGPMIVLIAVFLASINLTRGISSSGFARVDWTEVKTADGRARASLPGKPEESTRSMDGEFGEVKVHLFKFVTNGGRCVYLFMYADHPEATFAKGTIEDFLKAARDFSLESLGGKLLDQSDKTRNGLKGQEFRVDVPAKKLVMHARTVIQQPRVYSLSVFLPKDEKAPYDVDTFFGSLKIDGPVKPKK
jgi:hypothetical protein